MRIVLIGFEYTGKRSLASLISRWIIDEMGAPIVRWHDHFVVPRLDSHAIYRAKCVAAPIGKAAADLNAFRQGLLPYLDARDLDRLGRRRSEVRPTAAPAKPVRSAAP